MSRKSRRRRHKKNKFMSSVLYYVLVLALVAGLVFVVKVNHQERAERTEYKEKLAGKETEEDIGVLDDMMVRKRRQIQQQINDKKYQKLLHLFGNKAIITCR